MVLSGFSYSFSAFDLGSLYICSSSSDTNTSLCLGPFFFFFLLPFVAHLPSEFNEHLTRGLKHIVWSRSSAIHHHDYKKGFLGYEDIRHAIPKSNKWTISYNVHILQSNIRMFIETPGTSLWNQILVGKVFWTLSTSL